MPHHIVSYSYPCPGFQPYHGVTASSISRSWRISPIPLLVLLFRQIYQSGFGNHFSSEAIVGALPKGQNSPVVCPFGLYAEQISGTSFTAPRKINQRSWLYRIKPSVTHEPFKPRVPNHGKLVSEFNQYNSSATPTQLRWKPVGIPEAPTDFICGMYTVCGAGSSYLRHGYAIHM